MSLRPHHTGDICTTRKTIDNKFFICENINIFGYLGARGRGEASTIRLGPSWFTSTLSFILNLHVNDRHDHDNDDNEYLQCDMYKLTIRKMIKTRQLGRPRSPANRFRN